MRIKIMDYTIETHYDLSPESPRKWDNLGTIYTRDYRFMEDKGLIDDVYEKGFNEKNIVLDIYCYEHGAIALRTTPFSDRWDSGFFGCIAVSKKDAAKAFGQKYCTKAVREKTENVLIGEIQTYNDYINGNVFGFQIRDEFGQIIDSCSGYYGDDEYKYMLEECKDVIYTIKKNI